MFKRSITNRLERDEGFEHMISAFESATEYGDITWYPSQRRVVFRHDIKVPITTKGKGQNDFTGFRPQPRLLIESLRTSEELLEATDNAGGKCLLSKEQVMNLLEFSGYPVIGNQSDMQTSDALNGICTQDHA
ncbi:hypothetical protein QJS10_CPB13g00101 [Acorus calamus]|uniref:Uncharacterized protein n=1 Tax=Acorus calamus TaxID=4465 RepID=A0AAV9DJ95_ACOCL|nr:hypothetical protein QJS10_CPB13g00101 [Acorus calamus]